MQEQMAWVGTSLGTQGKGVANYKHQILPTRLLLLILLVLGLVCPGLLRASCASPGNAIEAENCLPGTAQSTWDIGTPPTSGTGDPTIQGFGDNISVNVGQTINFKINTNANAYHIDIYRMGYYQGNGARLILGQALNNPILPSATLPQTQPACLTDVTTGLYDCGNWAVSASWTVPTTAVSGIYFARLVRNDTGGASHIFFIVRNDASTSNIFFQASDTSWQAYNDYGGQNLYGCNGAFNLSCRAYKVSYNRPFHTRDFQQESVTWVLGNEYPMVRWLEANGYDVTYTTDTDTDRHGSLILNHKLWMSNGHDEYWSANQRTNVLAARNAGVHLAFFSGNTMFWKTRWENSIDGTNTQYRTLVCYKETVGDVTDPLDPPTWTGTWRDPTKSPPADGGQPENAVKGNLFRMNGGQAATMQVPQADGLMRFWRNTVVAALPAGQTASLAPGTVGAEFDDDEDNGFRPAGLFELSATSVFDSTNYLLDYGVTYGAGTAINKVVMYKAPSGALVFSTGTYRWSWGLDNNHDDSDLGATTDPSMQQATVNLFADMGIQPVSLQSPLTPATASGDTTPPTSTITSPIAGANLAPGVVTVTGTAVDAGGGVVAGVEVSLDGGTTWHPAVGRGSWTYTGALPGTATATIRSRAVDDSGNLETPSAGVTVNITEQTCPCTIWPSSASPVVSDVGQDSPVELGVKFEADFNGNVSGIRFYKSAANTGTHVGNLWAASGNLLASATFTNESGSGWQEVDFSSPVAILANTEYIASYHTSVGHYAADAQYFATSNYDDPPLHALSTGISGGDGVFSYGSGSSLPSSTYNAANYWVDLVYSPSTTARLTAITVTPSQATIQVGGNQQFTATGAFSDGTQQNITSQVTWSSSNPVAATINGSGLATGLSGAGPTITASESGISGSALLSVLGGPLVVTTSSLPVANQNTPYGFQIVATGGVQPYTWTLLSGSLPAGISMSSTGSLSGTPTTLQTTTFTVQVTDSGTKDSLNPPQTATQTLSLSVYPPALIITIFSPNSVPTVADAGPDISVELGVKFRSDSNGIISAIRFYKSANNVGTHVGSLWTLNGTLLGSVTFTSETASGWQQANFAGPIPITAGTIYIASYHCAQGDYADDLNYFDNSGVDNPPLHALADGVSGANGVFAYGPSTLFPNDNTLGSNYWVDVVFVESVPDATPPTVISINPPNGGSGAPLQGPVNIQFSKAINPTTATSSTVMLHDSSNNLVPATLAYNAETETVTLTPNSALQNSATYTVTVVGGSTDPRIKDLVGNALAANYVSTFITAPPTPPINSGPGGPILVVSAASSPLSLYYAEILRAEGLNEFSVLDISQVQSSTLASYDVVLLGNTPLNPAQVTMFTNWVNGGGNLIAMHPDPQLAGLLGINDTGTALSNAYVLMNTTANLPGAGLVGQTIQFHGPAELYTLNGAYDLADLYSNASTPSGNPAVTANFVGAGLAVAFAYDLAQSVVYTRQGNPAWSGEARDTAGNPPNDPPIRAYNLFFGAASFDPEPDWIDFNKVQIPQADEQQRLLANLIVELNFKRPLPRFGYFPRNLPAVVVLTGDDHGAFYASGGATAARFDQLLQASTPGCDVDSWQCYRSTAYVFAPSMATNPLTDAQAADFIAAGFEIGAHIDTNPDCSDYTSMSVLDADYTAELSSFASGYPSVPPNQTHRMHCVIWSDYDSQPQVEFNHGIRLDTSYYYYPPTWINNLPGMFTGSGMPMRFTTLGGNMVDVYQATTQMTDESGQTYPFNIDTLLDNALNLGYYGAFVANMHNDTADSTAASSIGAVAILASAQAHNVPIISSLQLLKWLDGRNGSSFSLQSWDGFTLNFNILVGANALGLQAMLPAQFFGTPLNSLTLNGAPVSYTLQTIKGFQYAVFAASSNGTYSAQYNVLASVTASPNSVVGGNPSTGTVIVSSPAPAGGLVVTLQSSNPVVAAVPATVTIAAGQTSAQFNITTTQVTGNAPVSITGSFNGASLQGSLLVTAQPITGLTLIGVSLYPNIVVGGAGSTGTVTLSSVAPTGGVVVNLSSSDPSTTVPTTVTVPANSTTANFPITTTAVGTVTQVNITGSYNSNARAAFTVNPGSLISQTGWTLLSVDSQETVCYNGAATNAFDGNPATLWHTQFCNGAPPTPHQISINLGVSYNLTGFQYLPRQDGSACGWIKDYAFYVSADGVSWGTAVATGTFNYAGLSTICPGPGASVPRAIQIAFPQTTGQYIRLVALDELNGNPWTSAAELNVLGTFSGSGAPLAVAQVIVNPTIVVGGASSVGTVSLNGPAPSGGAVVSLSSSDPSTTVPTTVTVPAASYSTTFAITTTAVGTVTQVKISGSYSSSNAQAAFTVNPGSLISQAGWTLLSVDSQETVCYSGAATNAFDGNPATMWHTQFCNGTPATPHQISINLGGSYNLTGFQYLPRQDGSACGWIKDYAFYISSDGVNWGTAVASGTFNYGSLSRNCPGPGAGVPAALQIAFPQTTGQYIKLVALDELNGNPWTSAAEIDVLGTISASSPPPALAQVTVKPAVVVGGASAQGTVTLSEPAPTGGAVVSLSSSNSSATVPATVMVPAGTYSANFTATTTAVGVVTQLNISGSYNGGAQAALTVNPGGPISQAGWTLLSVDSQETVCYNGTATNAFDGNPATMWHTQFCNGAPATPHQISINLGASYSLTGFQYLPRQDGSACGWIKDYAFYVSADGVSWGTAVATGTFNYTGLSTNCPGPGAGVPAAIQIAFPQTSGQYVKLVALDELNGNPWTSAAELNVFGH